MKFAGGSWPWRMGGVNIEDWTMGRLFDQPRGKDSNPETRRSMDRQAATSAERETTGGRLLHLWCLCWIGILVPFQELFSWYNCIRSTCCSYCIYHFQTTIMFLFVLTYVWARKNVWCLCMNIWGLSKTYVKGSNYRIYQSIRNNLSDFWIIQKRYR